MEYITGRSNEVAMMTSFSDVPTNKRPLGKKWVLTVADGRFKGRLVALAWKQKHGTECTFSFTFVATLGTSYN